MGGTPHFNSLVNRGISNISHAPMSDSDRLAPRVEDGWTIITADKKPSAHFEHDVAVVDGKPEILSSYAWIEEALALVK